MGHHRPYEGASAHPDQRSLRTRTSTQPSVHRIKYRLVYVVDGERVVGYDNERGKGDHKHIRGAQTPYGFKDVPTLIRDFLQDIKEIES